MCSRPKKYAEILIYLFLKTVLEFFLICLLTKTIACELVDVNGNLQSHHNCFIDSSQLYFFLISLKHNKISDINCICI